MQIITLKKAQAALADLVHQIAGGEEFIITQNGEPKAKLSAMPSRKHVQPRAGSLTGKIWMSPDFDAPMDDFKGY